jgi:hypothetical protein
LFLRLIMYAPGSLNGRMQSYHSVTWVSACLLLVWTTVTPRRERLGASSSAHGRGYPQITCQISHAKNPHHARVTPAKTRRAAKGNKRAQGRVGILLANMSASPSSASRLGTKLEIHHGVATFQSNTGAWPALK